MDDYQRIINGEELKGEVRENELEYIARFNLPGMDKRNIKISIIETPEGNLLAMTARRDYDRVIETSHSRMISGRHQRIFKAISLKGEIDRVGIKTNYENGVMEVIIPKRQQD